MVSCEFCSGTRRNIAVLLEAGVEVGHQSAVVVPQKGIAGHHEDEEVVATLLVEGGMEICFLVSPLILKL